MTESDADTSLYRGGHFYQMLHAGRSRDLPHYLSLLADKPGARVLELGAGAGRVALAMAAEGAQVTAVDRSADMLALLQTALAEQSPAVRRRVTTLHAAILTLELPTRFDLITCPFNGIGHQHTQEQLAGFFACAHTHLATDGWLAFDALLPRPELLAGQRSDVPWFRHPECGADCRWSETTQYDAITQILHLQGTVRYLKEENADETRDLYLRQFFPQETLLLIRHHGFVLQRAPINLEDVLAYVCRPREQPPRAAT